MRIMDEQQPIPIVRGIHAGRASIPAPHASGPRDPCRAPNCLNTTNSGKPYCLEHIDLMPYVIEMEDRRLS